jgi:hypothetical protein
VADGKPISVAFHAKDFGWSSPAQSHCGVQDCLKHRLQIERRAADDLEHVAGRGLILERFLKIARSVLQLIKQPRILHRDHRLLGKVLDQCNLLVGKRTHFLAKEAEYAEDSVSFDEGYA